VPEAPPLPVPPAFVPPVAGTPPVATDPPEPLVPPVLDPPVPDVPPVSGLVVPPLPPPPFESKVHAATATRRDATRQWNTATRRELSFVVSMGLPATAINAERGGSWRFA